MKKLLLTWLLLWCSALWAADATPVSILYKRESAESAARLDTAVQSALQSLEEKLIDSGYAVIQPEPKIYAELDRAAGVVINFAPDAGLVLVFDLIRSKRPDRNSDMNWAEVRLKARLFQGRRVLASLSGYDQIAHRSNAEDKAFEAGARRAAATLADKLLEKLATAPAPETVAAAAPPAPPALPIVPPAPTLVAPAQRWAVIFGVSDFSQVRKLSPGYGVSDLGGVRGDIRSLEQVARQSGIPASNIITLLDKTATTAALRQALEQLRQRTGPQDQVLLYISSHGAAKEEGVSGMGYPVSYDTRINDRGTLIDFEEIQQRLRALPAKRVLWIADTCHAGGAATGMKVVEFSTRNIGVKPMNTGLAAEAAAAPVGPDKDFAVLTASRAEQESLDDPNTGHGLFTYYLLQALNKDAKRTVYRLYKDDLEEAVPQAARAKAGGHRQQPGFARTGQGDQIVF